jgi:hypothetical protein
VIPSISGSETFHVSGNAGPEKTYKENIDRVWNRSFTFHEKVVDEKGQPVRGARVYMVVEKTVVVDANHEFVQVEHAVVTDNSGRFTVGPVPGWRIALKEIKSDDHLFPPALQPSLFFFQLPIP